MLETNERINTGKQVIPDYMRGGRGVVDRESVGDVKYWTDELS